MKYLLTLVALLITTTHVNAEEFILVLTNENTCPLSRTVELQFQSPDVVQQLKNNGQRYRVMHGQDALQHVKNFQVKWYPSILKLEKNDGKWMLKEKIIGRTNRQFLLDFLGNKGIIRKEFAAPAPPVRSYSIQNSGSS